MGDGSEIVGGSPRHFALIHVSSMTRDDNLLGCPLLQEERGWGEDYLFHLHPRQHFQNPIFNVPDDVHVSRKMIAHETETEH